MRRCDSQKGGTYESAEIVLSGERQSRGEADPWQAFLDYHCRPGRFGISILLLGSPGAPGQDPYAQTIGPQGKRVFVDPDFAFSQALIDYADGFAAIRREFKLILPINKYNFQNYMIYGWQLTTGSDEEKRQAGEISKFLDIYENSFPDE